MHQSPEGRPIRFRLAAIFALSASLGLVGCGHDRQDAAAPIRNVVIVLVDTLRADHLGLYGYARDTTPNLDRFARDAVVFENAYSVSPWTRTSVVSMFTSLHPPAHGCQDREDRAADELQMLAEYLKARGFATGGFSTNISVSAEFNLTQGFEDFTYFERAPWFARRPGRVDPGYVPIEGMLPATRRWLDRVGDRPFFLYFHSTDPHWRYLPPREFALWGSENLGLYDGEVRYTDHYVQQLIDHLEALGQLDETLFIFTSDHGEELADHGDFGHGHTLYNELLRVPLIVRHPSLVAARRTELVRSVDLLPTIAELLALPIDGAPVQGRTLVPLLRGQPDPQDTEQFIAGEVMYPSKIEGMSLQRRGWKAIWTIQSQLRPGFLYAKNDRWELYHTETEPGETRDLAASEPGRLASLRDELRSLRRQFSSDSPAAASLRPEEGLSAEALEALRSLGYVE